MKIVRDAFVLLFVGGAMTLALGGEASPIVEKGPGGEPRPWTNVALPEENETFHFAFISDRTGGHREGVFEDAIKKLNLLGPAFVISVGDLVEGMADVPLGQTDIREVMRRQYDEVEQIISPLRPRFYFLPGNHDYYAQTELGPIWNERFGRAYHAFTFGNVLFMLLNTEEGGYANFGPAQTEWAVKTLKEHPDVRWTFLVMHVPAWVSMRHKGWNEIESALQGRGHTAVCGDLHNYSLQRYGDADHIVLATTGGSSRLRGPAEGTFDHVTQVTFRKGEKEPLIANLELKGIFAKDLRTKPFDPDEADMNGAFELWTDPIMLRPEYAGGPFVLTAYNSSTRPLRFEGKVSSQAAGIVVTPDTFYFTAAPKSDTAFPMVVTTQAPLNAPAQKPFAIDLRVTLADSERAVFRQATLPARPVETFAAPMLKGEAVVDGRLDEWTDVRFYDMTAPSEAEQRGASFATAYTDESILVAAKVRDPDPGMVRDHNPQQHAEFLYHDVAGAIFQENAIEVRLDARAEPDRSHGNGWNWFTGHLFLASYPGSATEPLVPMLAEKLPVKVSQAVVHESGSYTFELAIPISYLRQLLGDDWQAYRLNIVIHDRTADGRFIRYSWQPDWRSSDNAFGSGTFFRE
jgi:hypothetical protein